MAYISVAVNVDPAAITQEKIDRLQALIPGLEVRPPHVLYFLLEVTSDRDAQNLQVLTEQLDLIWDTLGEKMLRVPRLLATRATGQSTWTLTAAVTNPVGYLIEAGTQLTLTAADGSRVGFETVADVTIPQGSSATAAGAVQIVATEAGAAGTGLQSDPILETALADVQSVTVTAPTTSGRDEEDVDSYRSRLGDETELMARTLVLAADYEARVRSLLPGGRSLAIDNYLPGTGAGQAGHITVAVVDVNGADPGSTLRGELETSMQDDSVAGLDVHVIAATYNDIDVVFAGKAYPDFDPADVEARAEAAVLDYISPARHGLPPFGDQRLWVDRPVLRYKELVAVVENVDGYDYTTSLTVNGGTADITMTGPAAMPAAPPTSSVSGTVTAP